MTVPRFFGGSVRRKSLLLLDKGTIRQRGRPVGRPRVKILPAAVKIPNAAGLLQRDRGRVVGVR